MSGIQTDFLVFDMSNLLHKTFYIHQTDDFDMLTKLTFHSSLVTMNKYFKLYKPKKIVCVFDRPNWRKDYTRSDMCYTKHVYKGTRRLNMDDDQRARYELFSEFVAAFEVMLRDFTSIYSLSRDGLEADDIISGLAHIFAGEDTTPNGMSYSGSLKSTSDGSVVLVSADKDFIQLLRYPNLRLVDPATGKERDLSEWDHDHHLYLFEKSFTGDRGDNVASALPRLQKKKIKKAYTDEALFTDITQTEWTDPDGDTRKVLPQYEENRMLVDLTGQPDFVHQLIWDAIESEFSRPKKYNHFAFLGWLGRQQLAAVSKNLENLTTMISL